MQDRNDDSIQGDEELLPERGNPFSIKDGSPELNAVDEYGDIIQAGEERSIAETSFSDEPKTEQEDTIHPRPREDGSPGAIGPLLPEDIEAVHVPPPIVEDATPFDPKEWLIYNRCVMFGANHFANLLPPSAG